MPPVEPRATFDDAIAEARDHGFEYIVFNYTPLRKNALAWIFTELLLKS